MDNWPIAFRVATGSSGEHRPAAADPSGGFLTRTRALDGMQKEAVVRCGADETSWRLLCDEGPWLNGTDLAPFPLAFFAAGVAACFMSDILAQATEANVRPGTLNLHIDHFFTMEGSILKGTMAAAVEPIHMLADAGGEVDDETLESIITGALNKRSKANRALVTRLPSRFCLSVNGQAVEWPGMASDLLAGAADPAPLFEQLEPREGRDLPEAIIRKDEATTVSGGSAVGLQSDQKRTVHIHTDARLRADGLKEIAVQCMTPLGSRFVFLSDDSVEEGGQGRAPCGLTYLSAGVAFCFMTQLGRYANIKKMRLLNYRIVQQTAFGLDPSPVETAVFLDSEDSAENNLKMVQMGEQTCYLHTAFREPVEVLLKVGGR